MDFLREMVSGKKKRFRQQGYNLDLTYVTPRIIAMSFPGEGLTGLYRNPIDQVSNLLNKNHDDQYIVFNLCGKKYDTTKFGSRVFEFQWEDHHSPALDIHQYLLCNPLNCNLSLAHIKNVVAIHCLAGKGRTGTVICCYLLYSGRFSNVNDVLAYYGKKRFAVEGLGVNQPCQMRYIEYFHRLLTGDRIYPTLRYIREIKFIGRPKLNMDGGCRPYCELIDVRTLKELYSQKSKNNEIKKFTNDNVFSIKLEQITPLYGDILLNIRNIGVMKEEKMCRISFNTAFLGKDPLLKLGVLDLDPSQVATDNRFPIEFDFVCKCTEHTKFEDKCELCMGQMQKETLYWGKIYLILDRYKKPDPLLASTLVFGNDADDVEQILLLSQGIILIHYVFIKVEKGEICCLEGNLDDLREKSATNTFTFQLEELDKKQQQQLKQQQQQQQKPNK